MLIPDRLRVPKLIVAAVLFAVGALYVARAAQQLVTTNGYDLHLRWVEEQYVLRARDPFRVYARWLAENGGDTPNLRSSHQWHVEAPVLFRPERIRDDVFSDLGPPGWPNYPPWAQFAGLPFVALPWPAVCWWYLLVNFAALAFLTIWIDRALRAYPLQDRLLTIAAALAFTSVASTLRLGQYGIIVVAALASAQLAMRRGNSFLAGIAFGFAMLKPTIAAPFLLIPFFRRDWKILASAAGFVALGSLFTWVYVGTDPVSMLRNMLTLPPDVYHSGGENSIRWLMELGLSPGVAFVLAAAVGGAVAVIAGWKFRASSLDILFAIAAVVSRYWTHHDLYDDLVLMFLLIPVARIALDRNSVGWWGLFALLGISLWIPSRYANTMAPLHAFHGTVCLATFVALLMSERSSPEPAVDPQSARLGIAESSPGTS
jgi:hypothetical protein